MHARDSFIFSDTWQGHCLRKWLRDLTQKTKSILFHFANLLYSGLCNTRENENCYQQLKIIYEQLFGKLEEEIHGYSKKEIEELAQQYKMIFSQKGK